jgi:hypothetical protein
MNESHPPTILDEQLDLLVDGALPPADRRALLLTLDAAPGGWRRCALAFLEAQAWRAALAPAGKKAAVADPDFDPLPLRPKARPGRSRLAPLARFAALLLVGFLAGRLTFLPASQTGPAPLVVEADPPPPAAKVPEAEPVEPEPVAYLTLTSHDTAADPAASPGVPLYAGPGLDDDWLRSQPSFVPEEVRKELENRGYQLDSQRRLISVQVDNEGRYISVPVDNVSLRYVGGPL